MTQRLVKELRPLALPWAVAAAGSMAPASSDLGVALAGLACFGGFAVVAATAFGAEFQQRTLTLWLSQPATRYQLWKEKLLGVALAGALLVVLNWRVQQHLPSAAAALPITAFPMMAGMFIFSGICSSAWWIQVTGSTARGISVSFATQIVIFAGAVLGLGRIFGPIGTIAWSDLPFTQIFISSLIYSAAWLWLGRGCWKPNQLRAAAVATALLVLCGISSLLAQHHSGTKSSGSEDCFVVMFFAATLCVFRCNSDSDPILVGQ